MQLQRQAAVTEANESVAADASTQSCQFCSKKPAICRRVGMMRV